MDYYDFRDLGTSPPMDTKRKLFFSYCEWEYTSVTLKIKSQEDMSWFFFFAVHKAPPAPFSETFLCPTQNQTVLLLKAKTKQNYLPLIHFIFLVQTYKKKTLQFIGGLRTTFPNLVPLILKLSQNDPCQRKYRRRNKWWPGHLSSHSHGMSRGHTFHYEHVFLSA
jgi:hypothetical protein